MVKINQRRTISQVESHVLNVGCGWVKFEATTFDRHISQAAHYLSSWSRTFTLKSFQLYSEQTTLPSFGTIIKTVSSTLTHAHPPGCVGIRLSPASSASSLQLPRHDSITLRPHLRSASLNPARPRSPSTGLLIPKHMFLSSEYIEIKTHKINKFWWIPDYLSGMYCSKQAKVFRGSQIQTELCLLLLFLFILTVSFFVFWSSWVCQSCRR